MMQCNIIFLTQILRAWHDRFHAFEKEIEKKKKKTSKKNYKIYFIYINVTQVWEQKHDECLCCVH